MFTAATTAAATAGFQIILHLFERPRLFMLALHQRNDPLNDRVSG
ncbi:MAG: hypothetical protein ACXWC1_34335 [Burkholderiales bacterium]